MRLELCLWWLVILTAKTVVTVSNSSFEPKQVTVHVGTVVEWVDGGGKHTVEADDGSFKSPVLVSGDHFDYAFPQPGIYPYHCMFHGDVGGKDMAGSVVVVR